MYFSVGEGVVLRTQHIMLRIVNIYMLLIIALYLHYYYILCYLSNICVYYAFTSYLNMHVVLIYSLTYISPILYYYLLYTVYYTVILSPTTTLYILLLCITSLIFSIFILFPRKLSRANVVIK